MRQQWIGSSEIAAVMGFSSFCTPFEIFQKKRGNLPESYTDSERMRAGRYLEDSIAQMAADERGWHLRKTTGYCIHPRLRGMSASPDVFAHDESRGWGILEVKNVDYIQFRDKWTDGEPPEQYLLQLQHQLAVTGLQWGAVVALVGGNDLQVFFYDRHEAIIQKIEGAVNRFWEDVALNREPQPFADDYALMSQLYPHREEPIDLSGDNEIPDLCKAYLQASDQRKELEKQEKAIKSRIAQKLQGHAEAILPGWSIKNPEITMNYKPQPARTSTQRRLTIKEMTQ